MPASGFVVVSTQPNAAGAELLAGLLLSGGMRVVVEPLTDAEYPGTAGGAFRVWPLLGLAALVVGLVVLLR